LRRLGDARVAELRPRTPRPAAAVNYGL